METLKPLRVVSIADAALDWPEMAKAYTGTEGKYASAIQEYAQSRDEKMVRELPGKSLTWFTVRRLDADIVDLALSQVSDHMKHRFSLQYAVSRIENLTGLDGQVYARLEPEDERRVDGVPQMFLSARQMALIAPQYVEEIGGVAFARSFLAPTTGVRYPLPRSWRLLLETKTHQVVADAAARLRSRGKEPPQEGATKATSGDSATAATATGKATGASTSRSTDSDAPSKRRRKRSKKSSK